MSAPAKAWAFAIYKVGMVFPLEPQMLEQAVERA